MTKLFLSGIEKLDSFSAQPASMVIELQNKASPNVLRNYIDLVRLLARIFVMNFIWLIFESRSVV